jgi:hypothetical protein
MSKRKKLLKKGPKKVTIKFIDETWIQIRNLKKCWIRIRIKSSVGDPDPHIFEPPGSGSIGQRYESGSGTGSRSFPFLK